MTNGAWYVYAKEFKPILFQLEHRYYGQSHPTGDLSLKNLAYLTSQQALADLAFFIESMNKQYELAPDVKWIAFGGSYPGNLAAWLRQKYPHLVHGAVSSSSPLMAKVDYTGYFGVVQDALRSISEECVAAVGNATAQIEKLMLSKDGKRTVDKKFKLCDKIEESSALDVSNFYSNLATMFGSVVQFNHDNTGFNEEYNLTTEQFCGIMTNKTLGAEIDRLAAINDIMMNIYGETCNEYTYESYVGPMKNVSWEAETSRQWTYQSCTEFGFFQTSDYNIFGNNFRIDLYVNVCKDLFGKQYTEKFMNDAIDRTNTIYGGLDIKVSNVVFVHGSLDPWHKLGITQTRDKDAPAILIKGAAHCANVYNSMRIDSPELRAARVEIRDYIAVWLNL
ncbi:unnamed protein product [Phyllotreta striolata]|uniref:Uncharacterized protein n=1 Tax=Phyllotreta striolata TaxID=444603 RepID=A0A9N9TG51_PHYSR|nr:unnamed protein product [Phyllotreta striolata]